MAQRIAAVARLDIHDLAVAAPRVGLRAPAVGYGMNLVTGMMAIGQLGPVGHPFCHVPDPDDLVAWYISTGGLRKRLNCLSNLADTLNELHSRGLVYADLNGGNALVSVRPDRHRVTLIDLDNLRYADDEPVPFRRPEFAPPEFESTLATRAGDQFALAVMAWSLLTTKNPFYGTALDQRSVADLNAVVSWACLAPMTASAANGGNAPIGLDRSRVVPPRLGQLCIQALDTTDPRSRPPASALAAAARSGAAAVVECSCGWQNFVGVSLCYRCDEQIGSSFVDVRDMLSGPHWPVSTVAISNAPVELDRASLGLPGPRGEIAVRISLSAGALDVEALTDDLTVESTADGTALRRRGRAPLLLSVRLP